METSHVFFSFKTRDKAGYIPYRFVLMAAMANAIGNKSLFYSKYESYKTVKKKEKKSVAMILKSMAKNAKSKNSEQESYLTESLDRIANPLWQYLNLSLGLKTWKRYLKI